MSCLTLGTGGVARNAAHCPACAWIGRVLPRASYVVRVGRRPRAEGVAASSGSICRWLWLLGSGWLGGIYHAGCSEDLAKSSLWLQSRTEGGVFANRSDRLLTGGKPGLEAGGRVRRRQPVEGLDSVLAANPPIDLTSCAPADAAARESAV